MFSVFDIENDVQKLYLKYNLNYIEYLQIKEILIKGISSLEIKMDSATIFFMNTGFFRLDENPNAIKHINEELKCSSKYHLIRNGDILYNTSLNEYQVTDGIYFIHKVNDCINFIKSIDFIPNVFKIIEEFPVHYWNHPVEVTISGRRIGFYGINNEHVFFSENIMKRIQPMTKQSIEFLLRHDPNFLDDDDPEERMEECLNSRIFRYKNKVYVISGESETTRPGYIRYDAPFYENKVPSRWGIFKALIWFLVLHRRSVIKVNHPDRLRQEGVFEEL